MNTAIRIFGYRLKGQLRDKGVIFWTIAFPFLLATFFSLALSNVSNGFERAKLGVVNNAQYEQNTTLKSQIEEQSKEDNEDAMFETTYFDAQEDAEKALANEEIEGLMMLNEKGEITLQFTKAGVSQTMIREFFDWYNQMNKTITNIATTNPASLAKISELTSQEYTYSKAPDGPIADIVVVFYYALLAMSCLYASFAGLRDIAILQANQSTLAARQSMAPVNKWKLVVVTLSSTVLVQFITILLLIAYLKFGLGVSFGSNIALLILASFLSVVFGVLLGAFIGVILKTNLSGKIAVVLAFSMICSYLAGLMDSAVKTKVIQKAPIMQYINPGNLIADAFYSLYYVRDMTRYWMNIGILSAGIIAMLLVVTLILRKQSYRSLAI
ncbi:MAG TPA: ABC transporter permease [Bacillota bacterium]|nr:ABC transporter permease [Bacillota bacterium]HPE38049.1 ABC transporter permease [Bacillota bacterium]